MIVVDTSALISIMTGESDAGTLAAHLAGATRACVGAPTALEFMLVAHGRFGSRGARDAALILEHPAIEIVAWTPELVAIAAEASARFGGRPARLNFGDCMSYAIAKSLDAPLLCKGSDFGHTDIRMVL